jgi:hypothetical protein
MRRHSLVRKVCREFKECATTSRRPEDQGVSRNAHGSARVWSVGLIDCENNRRHFVRSELDLAASPLFREVAAAVRCPRGRRHRLRFRSDAYTRGSDRLGSWLVRALGPLRVRDAARKGEDPLAGLQRSQQPGPQGDARFLRSQRRTTAHIFADTDR